MTGALFTPGLPVGYFGYANRLAVEIDFSLAAWNTVGTHEVFTISGGLVRTLIVYHFSAACTSGGAGTIKFGREGSTGEYAPAIAVAACGANTTVIPASATPNSTVRAGLIFNDPGTNFPDMLNAVRDQGYEIEVADFLTGTLQAVCYWSPVTTGGLVVAGTGGAL